MSKQDLMVVNFGEGKSAISITAEEVKQYLCPNITNAELYIVMGIMKSYELNPFKKEAYIIKYGDSPAQVVVGYEVYLKRAERHGNWRGMKVWTEGEFKRGQNWREETTLKGCIEIHRKNWKLPLYWEVEFSWAAPLFAIRPASGSLINVCILNKRRLKPQDWENGLLLEALRSLTMQASVKVGVFNKTA